MSNAECSRCHQPYTMERSRDPLCRGCRELVATWHAPERLTDLAQQGFEEAMGMRPPSYQYPGLPPATGLKAQPWASGTGMAPQQMLGWSDQDGAWISEDGWDATTGDEPVLAGQVRCRHCAAVLTAGPDDTWTGPGESADCDEIGIPHQPMPQGMAGGRE